MAVKNGWAESLRVRGARKALLSDASTENTLGWDKEAGKRKRSEEHTSELQSH